MSFSMIGKTLGIAKSTVRDVINRFKTNITVDRAKGSGEKTGSVNKKLTNKIFQSCRKNPGISDGDRAKNSRNIDIKCSKNTNTGRL